MKLTVDFAVSFFFYPAIRDRLFLCRESGEEERKREDVKICR